MVRNDKIRKAFGKLKCNNKNYFYCTYICPQEDIVGQRGSMCYTCKLIRDKWEKKNVK